MKVPVKLASPYSLTWGSARLFRRKVAFAQAAFLFRSRGTSLGLPKALRKYVYGVYAATDDGMCHCSDILVRLEPEGMIIACLRL